MKNIWKVISEFLFGKKDALSESCENVYKELEKVKNSYISDEAFDSLSTEQQKTVLEKEISDAELQMNIISGNEPYLMGTSLDYKTEPLVKERPVLTGTKTIQEYPNQSVVITEPEFVGIKTVDKKGNIHFFHPNDNKEIKLDEKKSEEIKATKKKRQYKKRGKK